MEVNLMELYYSFGFVHLKLAGICEQLSGEKGKKCLENRHQKHVFGRTGYAGFRMEN